MLRTNLLVAIGITVLTACGGGSGSSVGGVAGDVAGGSLDLLPDDFGDQDGPQNDPSTGTSTPPTGALATRLFNGEDAQSQTTYWRCGDAERARDPDSTNYYGMIFLQDGTGSYATGGQLVDLFWGTTDEEIQFTVSGFNVTTAFTNVNFLADHEFTANLTVDGEVDEPIRCDLYSVNNQSVGGLAARISNGANTTSQETYWRCGDTTRPRDETADYYGMVFLEDGTGAYVTGGEVSDITWSEAGNQVDFTIDGFQSSTAYADISFGADFEFTADLYVADQFSEPVRCELYKLNDEPVGGIAERVSNGPNIRSQTHYWRCGDADRPKTDDASYYGMVFFSDGTGGYVTGGVIANITWWTDGSDLNFVIDGFTASTAYVDVAFTEIHEFTADLYVDDQFDEPIRCDLYSLDDIRQDG